MCQIRAGGVCVKMGGTVWNTLKVDGAEKRGEKTKSLRGVDEKDQKLLRCFC